MGFERALNAILEAGPPGQTRMDAQRARRYGHTELGGYFRIGDLAAASFAALDLARIALGTAPSLTRIHTSIPLAEAWYRSSLRPSGWNPPDPWDELSGVFKTADGWIRTHANVPAHRDALILALRLPPDATRDALARALRAVSGVESEDLVIGHGGAAAVWQRHDVWARSAPGAAVANEPLIAWEDRGSARAWIPGPAGRPLSGVRVLDLTRVIAGPVATRALALLGADVLRIDPVEWSEPALEPDMLLGKRVFRLNLRDRRDREKFLDLLCSADILIAGYRADALEKLGFGEHERARLNPGLIEILLNAYGWEGPWRTRRGFDSLVQFSSGIARIEADAGEPPLSLPVQALDHTTGMLAAIAALDALASAQTRGRSLRARLSLARSGVLLEDLRMHGRTEAPGGTMSVPLSGHTEETAWGPARRLLWPVNPTEFAPDRVLPAGSRASAAQWLARVSAPATNPT